MAVKGKTCKLCGKAIRFVYDYCATCYNANVSSSFIDNTPRHQCVGCGAKIGTRYKYCVTCAKKRGFLKDNKDY